MSQHCPRRFHPRRSWFFRQGEGSSDSDSMWPGTLPPPCLVSQLSFMSPACLQHPRRPAWPKPAHSSQRSPLPAQALPSPRPTAVSKPNYCHVELQGSRDTIPDSSSSPTNGPAPATEGSRACVRSILTFQIPDEGHGLDGVAAVGEGLDDVVLHDAQHAEASLVTCEQGRSGAVKDERPTEFPTRPLPPNTGT